ncbi:MAG: hypothetical protein JF619_30345 [Massilia sp.]|nr:hypothetical protein [Massilia sp.]
MDKHISYQGRKQLLWGLVLIGLGVAFYLDRQDLFDIDQLWHYWPLLMVAVGLNQVIGYPTARDFTSGLWTMFVGLWLFANFEHLWGMGFHNSWPFLIIAWGVSVILRPFIRDRFAANDVSSKENCHDQ